MESEAEGCLRAISKLTLGVGVAMMLIWALNSTAGATCIIAAGVSMAISLVVFHIRRRVFMKKMSKVQVQESYELDCELSIHDREVTVGELREFLEALDGHGFQAADAVLLKHAERGGPSSLKATRKRVNRPPTSSGIAS